MVVLGTLIGAFWFYFSAAPGFELVMQTPWWKLLLIMILGCLMFPTPPSMDIRGWKENNEEITTMRKFAVILVLSVIIPLSAFPEITLGYCLDKAMENYPLIKKYGIVEKTSALSLSDINRSWFPRVGVYAQATVQNVVPEFPQALKDVLVQLGQEAEGLGHMQYKAGVDLSQTIWDGGVSKAQRNIERASASERKAELDVRMYAVREKVMDLYFGILLMDEQIAQTENTISLLKANLSLMESMLRGGVAMQSDVDMLQAQLLTMSQQLISARSAEGAYRDVLSVYVGENLDNKTLLKPDATVPALIDRSGRR